MREVEPAPAATDRPRPGTLRRLHLPTSVRDALLRAAHTALPAEACGLLFGSRCGDEAEGTCVTPLPNCAEAPRRGFALDPHDFATALADGERSGLAWLGFFHSHPHGGADLSAVDRSTCWPECLHLVVAADTDEVRAHWIEPSRRVRTVPLCSEARP